MRKPHPRSVLKTLPEDDQAALYEFLASDRKRTLADGVAWLRSNNGIRTNDSSLSDWMGWYEMNLEIGSWQTDVEDVKQQLEAMGTDPDLVAKLGEARFLGLAAKKGDVEMYAKVSSIIQRHHELKASQQTHADKMQLEGRKLKRKDRALDQANRKLEQAERRIQALEDQAEAAKKAAEKTKEALKSGGMDEKTRASLIAEMDRMILGKTEKPKA